MPLTICYGPLQDGSINQELCFERPAIKYTKTLPDPDNGGDMEVVKYALDDSDQDFIATELTQHEAEMLAARVCETAQDCKGGEWGWEVTQ